MITRLRRFGAFWYDFVIGDDWRVALGVAASLGITYAVTEASSSSAWWIVPVGVVLLLPMSLFRAIRRS